MTSVRSSLSDAASGIVGLELVHDSVDRRRLRRAVVALFPGLKEMEIKAFLVPGIERFSTEVAGKRMPPANHLAFFHRRVHFSTRLIAHDRIDFCAHRQLQKFGDDIIGAGRAGRAALRRLFSLDDIGNGFIGCVRADIGKHRLLRGGSDPMKFPKVELHFFAPDELLDVNTVIGQDNVQSVGFCDGIDIIGRGQ